MEPREQRLVIILADLSGYTKFMVENQLSAVHGQLCITALIETILREVAIPLQLQEIEGDAVFLYAAHPGDEDDWRVVLDQVRTKLPRFFEVFFAGVVTATESTPCRCAICSNADSLKLKVIVHSGSAVFHSMDAGETWNHVGVNIAEISQRIVTSLAIDNNGVIYAGTIAASYQDASIYRSSDEGDSWQKVSSIYGTVIDIEIHPNGTIYFVTSFGIFSLNNDDTLDSLELDRLSDLAITPAGELVAATQNLRIILF